MYPLNDSTGEGPHRSQNMSSRGVVYDAVEAKEGSLCTLPRQQAEQKSDTFLLGKLTLQSLVTDLTTS